MISAARQSAEIRLASEGGPFTGTRDHLEVRNLKVIAYESMIVLVPVLVFPSSCGFLRLDFRVLVLAIGGERGML